MKKNSIYSNKQTCTVYGLPVPKWPGNFSNDQLTEFLEKYMFLFHYLSADAKKKWENNSQMEHAISLYNKYRAFMKEPPVEHLTIRIHATSSEPSVTAVTPEPSVSSKNSQLIQINGLCEELKKLDFSSLSTDMLILLVETLSKMQEEAEVTLECKWEEEDMIKEQKRAEYNEKMKSLKEQMEAVEAEYKEYGFVA